MPVAGVAAHHPSVCTVVVLVLKHWYGLALRGTLADSLVFFRQSLKPDQRTCLRVMLAAMQNAPRENPDVFIEEREVELFRSYHSSLMYKVCTAAVVASPAAWLCMICRLPHHMPLCQQHNQTILVVDCHAAGHLGSNTAQLCSYEAAAGQQSNHRHILHGAPVLQCGC